MELFRLEHVTRYYGDLLAFQAAELRAVPGLIGLLGPNGAGKSTLLRMLLGLLPPSSGKVSVLGADVERRPLEVRSRAGYMPEHDGFVAGVSVLQFVALAGELHGMPRKHAYRRAHEVLGFLGMEESRYRDVAEQSTGGKQRAKLAQALVNDPDLLVLDEPTSGLDPFGRAAMLRLVRSFHREHGKSVILSTHLLEDVERTCDSVIILDGGRVLGNGRIDTLRGPRRRRYRMRIEGGIEGVRAELSRGGAVLAEATGRPQRPVTEFLVELGERQTTLDIFRAVAKSRALGEIEADRRQACILHELVPYEETLEELFERIVGRTKEAAAGKELALGA